MPQYLRAAVAVAVRSKDETSAAAAAAAPPAGEEAAPEAPLVVFVNSLSGGRHGPELKLGLQELLSEEQLLESASENEEEENEIGSLCWASSTGTMVAVGYVNGDIVLWNMSSKPPSLKGKQVDTSPNIIKLELASGNCRLPVIVLHWSAVTKADNEKGGHLFIYGGDDKGSEEVLTVLSLEYSGMDTVRCISRSNLNLNGSFADMILIPEVGSAEKNNTAALFVLTNPGHLNVYDGNLFSMQKFEGNIDALAEKFPDAVPTIDPRMTATKLCSLAVERDSSKGLLKVFDLSAVKPSGFVRYGLTCLENLADDGDGCAKATRENLRIMEWMLNLGI